MADDAKKEAAKLKSALTRRVKKLIAQTLEPLGFEQEDGQEWSRKTITMWQHCRFRFIKRRPEFSFEYGGSAGFRLDACADCWANARQDAATRETLTRFKTAFNEWEESNVMADAFVKVLPYPPKNKDEFEKFFTDFESILDAATDYFRNYSETGDLLRDYEAGLIERRVFLYGTDPRYRDFFLALEYCQIGAYAKAAEAFEEAARVLERREGWFEFFGSDFDLLAVDAAKIGADCMRRLAESQGKASE